MLYLVEGEVYDSPHALPPDQAIRMFEQTILPGLETLAQWEESGRIRGGAMAGYRRGYFIVDVASNEELGKLLRSLPFWGILKWHTTPLQSFRSALEGDREVIGRVKARMQK
jgi:hypothetical protein